MTGPPPIQQAGDCVTIRGATTLAAAYRATLAGITRRRADGLPSGDLQQLARALRRAHIDATSQPRHQLADSTSAAPCSNGQDGDDWIGVAAAADCLSVSRRQVQRLAEHDADLLGARRIGSIWALRKSAVLALAQRRKEAAE